MATRVGEMYAYVRACAYVPDVLVIDWLTASALAAAARSNCVRGLLHAFLVMPTCLVHCRLLFRDDPDEIMHVLMGRQL